VSSAVIKIYLSELIDVAKLGTRIRDIIKQYPNHATFQIIIVERWAANKRNPSKDNDVS
jgi:hypothetical protein